MYKTITTISTLIIFLLLYYHSAAIEAKGIYQIHNDSILVSISLFNDLDYDVYIQNQFWEIGKNDSNSVLPFYPGRGYFVNSLYFIQSNTDSISYRSEKRDYPNINKVDSVIKMTTMDTIKIEMVLKNIFPHKIKPVLYIRIPYFSDQDIISENTKPKNKKMYVFDFYNNNVFNQIIYQTPKGNLIKDQSSSDKVKIFEKIIDYIEINLSQK